MDKTVGDSVSSGTVNQFGAFEMEAVKVGEDSSIQHKKVIKPTYCLYITGGRSVYFFSWTNK